MKIVMVGGKGVPAASGGIERVVHDLSQALAYRGATVISYDRKWYVGDREPVPGVIRRYSYGIRTKHLDAMTHTFTAIILARRERPDIIHIHGVGPALLTLLARVIHPRSKIVVTFHCLDRTHTKWGWFAKKMLHLGEMFACVFAHRTITVSEIVAEYCLDAYGCQTVMIPNGVHVQNGFPTHAVEQNDLKPGSYFLMVSRLVPLKNHETAIRAYQELVKSHPEYKTHPLVIVGAPSGTEAYVDNLKRLAEGSPNIRFLGEVCGDELRALQEHAFCHLALSSTEGVSLSLLEAMATERPVIVTDIPGYLSVVGTDALVVSQKNVSELAEKMKHVLRMTDSERKQIGTRLKSRVLQNHSWDEIANQTHQLYEECLHSKSIITAHAKSKG